MGVLLVNYLNESTVEKKILPTYSVVPLGGGATELILEKTTSVLAENEDLKARVQQTAKQIQETEFQRTELSKKITLLQQRMQEIEDIRSSSVAKSAELEQKVKQLEEQIKAIKARPPSSPNQTGPSPEDAARIAELEKRLRELEAAQNQSETESILKELTGFEHEIPSIQRPRIPEVDMTEETVTWTFVDSQNNVYSFTKPTAEFIDEIVRLPEPQDVIEIELTGGTKQEIRDLSKFIVGSMPEAMDELYSVVSSDDEFVFEVWYIVSQFHVNSFEMKNDPKKPLDTFSKGEGDNEDLAILLADMIRSASATRDWELRFIYFDSDNISNPQKINHVALMIDNGKNVWLVEPTAKTIDEAFESRDKIRGHFNKIE